MGRLSPHLAMGPLNPPRVLVSSSEHPQRFLPRGRYLSQPQPQPQPQPYAAHSPVQPIQTGFLPPGGAVFAKAEGTC